MSAQLINPETGRLSVFTVERLHTLLGGDPRTEEMVLTFIRDKYGAKNLLMVPEHVAIQVLRRPADFLKAVKRHCEPQLPF
jgi:hypothetical protein